ncbi:hypothetical protein ACGFXB_46855 [Streptomyces canus]|uniref:hypothetical protein n=1 Tax=Streptomyces canus TaxID=58343 RepID=UPI0037156CB2
MPSVQILGKRSDVSPSEPFTLPTLHGCFGLGTVIGRSAGMAATAAEVLVPRHLAVVALVATGVAH